MGAIPLPLSSLRKRGSHAACRALSSGEAAVRSTGRGLECLDRRVLADIGLMETDVVAAVNA